MSGFARALVVALAGLAAGAGGVANLPDLKRIAEPAWRARPGRGRGRTTKDWSKRPPTCRCVPRKRVKKLAHPLPSAPRGKRWQDGKLIPRHG